MEKSTENNNNKNFLKESFKGDISKHHKEYLGTDIPEGYFAQSKISILEKIKEESKLETPKETKKELLFWMRPQFRYMAAASLVFLFGLTIWMQNANTNTIDEDTMELLSYSDDILINSLFVEDAELELFADATLINEIVIKAELSEQILDNLILDNIILEDSLLDNYMDEGFIETIIL